MNMGVYLAVGCMLSILLAIRANPATYIATLLYWLFLLIWSLGLIHPFTYTAINWIAFFSIRLSYHIDGLSRLFTLLISGIGLLVFVYANIYTQHKPQQRNKLLSLLQLFAVSMLCLVIADDMIMLFLAWELTSITSYLLIQFNTRDSEANQTGFNSLFITVLGSLFLLSGLIIINHLANTWSINTFLAQSSPLKESTMVTSALICLLLGAITKSAQWPTHFWLVGAMKAPTPVSAYLHSATMVNAGIYLLARFHPAFSQLTLWYTLLATIGSITMLISSFLSLFQDDLKAMFAYSTIFALGMMVYLLGSTHAQAIEAFAVFLLFHAIYKAGAFMLAGMIDQEYHTRQLTQLTGIARKRFLLTINIIILLSAMAGLPPFFGFTLKEMLFEAKLFSGSTSSLTIIISVISSMLIAAMSIRCIVQLIENNNVCNTVKTKMSYGFLCPTLLCLLIVIFSSLEPLLENIIQPAMKAILPFDKIDYASPHTGKSYFLSIVTILSGIVVYTLFRQFKLNKWQWMHTVKSRVIFEKMISHILALGKNITYHTQYISLLNQMRMVLFAIIVLPILILITHPNIMKNCHFSLMENWRFPLIISLSSLTLLCSKQFLYNLISLSTVGISTTLFFIFHGAVDLAITQLLVEVLIIVTMLITLNQNYTKEVMKKIDKIINFIIATFFGVVTTMLLLNLRAISFNDDLKFFYAKSSLALAYGKNIVNVILVDFRSLDTFGEVLVVLASTIAIILISVKYKKNRRGSSVDYT